MADIPVGFEKLFRSSPHLDNLGTFYYKGEGAEMVIMVQVQPKNSNARGQAHGGYLASIADVALGYATTTSRSPLQKLVTTSMSIDFVGSASIGDWIESSVDIQKVGRRVAYANCYLSVNGIRIVRCSAVFQNYGDVDSL